MPAASVRRLDDNLYDAFPLGAFLASLSVYGIRPTLHDYDRISRVLSTSGRWDLERLQGVLVALLAHDFEQEDILRRRFADFFDRQRVGVDREINVARALAELRQLQAEAGARTVKRPIVIPSRPPPIVRPPRPAFRTPQWFREINWWRVTFAVLVIVSLAVGGGFAHWWIYVVPPELPVQIPPPLPPPVHVPDKPQHQRRYPKEPFIKEIRPLAVPGALPWQLPAAAGGVLLLLCLWYGLWLRYAKRSPKDKMPEWDDSKPRRFNPGRIGGDPAPRLDRETLDHLADSLGYFQSEQPGNRLDMSASVAATLQQGFIDLVFQRRKQVRQVILLEDAYAEALAWNPVAAEFACGLERRGVPVWYGRFRGVPDRFVDANGGTVHLDDLEDHRNACLLLIFSDGKGLRFDRDRFLLETLARWPRIAWLELRERRAWDESSALIAAMGIPVYPASRAGLLQVIGRFMTEQGGGAAERNPEAWRGLPVWPSGVPRTAYVEQLLGDALPWAQACAMMLPPFSPGLADAVRRELFPELPPERLERLQALPGATISDAGLRFSPPVLATLRRGFLARWTEKDQQRALEFLLKQIQQAEPGDKDSPAHLAWEWRLERVRLELDPDRALHRLSELAGGPLGDAIRGDLQHVTVVDNPADRFVKLRLNPKTRDGLKRLLALAEHCGIKRTEAYPALRLHYTALSFLVLITGLCLGRAVWLYHQPPEQLFLALNHGEAAAMEASLHRVDDNDWSPVKAQKAHRRWPVEQDKAYRLALVHEGQTAIVSIKPMTASSEVVAGMGVSRLCVEEIAELGLTVVRCPSRGAGGAAEGVELPSWRDWLGQKAPAGRLLSVGLAIHTDGKPHADLEVLTDRLLETHSVDVLYRVAAAADGTVKLDQALAHIQSNLAPWLARTQLVWWSVGKGSDRLEPPGLATFDRVLRLGRGERTTWTKPVLALLTSKQELFPPEQSVLKAVAGCTAAGAGEPVLLSAAVERVVSGKTVPLPEMVEIPAGEFQMGSPESEEGRDSNERQHGVKVERFALGKYEVTVKEFRYFVEATQYQTEAEKGEGCYGWTGKDWKLDPKFSWRNLGFPQEDNHPVVCVSWNDAVAYLEWLSQETGQHYRLPTEAEWEYAARAGTTTARYWGDDPNKGCQYANVADLTVKDKFANWPIMNCRDGYVYTAPVGRFKANSFGLHDILGNVWEWCSDWYGPYSTGLLQNPTGAATGGARVVRGGSWIAYARYVRAASRRANVPGDRRGNLGFRPARVQVSQ